MAIGKKEGNLKVISFKNGGIKLDNDEAWINPSREIKLQLTSYLESIRPLHGKPVIVEVEDTYYHSIIPNPSQKDVFTNVQNQPVSVSRELLIVRQNSGSQAIGVLEVMQKEGLLKGKTQEQIQALFYQLAEKWEGWCFR